MSATMKAFTYYGDHDVRFEDRPMPKVLAPTDAVVKLTKTTICGTDLGIYKGKNPEIEQTALAKTGKWDGRILGHEGVGVVVEVGSAVKNVKVGDKVIISCVSKCGTCENCAKQLYAHCRNGGGWIFGYMIDGTLAEYVRTPFADTSLVPLPDDLDTDVAVLLSDVLPTAFEIGVQRGNVEPGSTVAVVGAGPIGIGALITAQLYSPGRLIVVDVDDNRLALAKELGATEVVNPAKCDAVEEILRLTNGRGVDSAIECVGVPATFDLAQKILKEGATLANVGVHGKPVQFDLDKLWIKNVTVNTGLVNSNTVPMLLKVAQTGKFPMHRLATHHFTFDQMEEAFDVFKRGAETQAIKVIITFDK